MNWGFRSELIKNKCKYFNMYATFVDAHTIKLTKPGGNEQTVTTDKVVIATGGRPSYPGIPGDKEFGITSDDIFSLKKAPGKTLVVGASYVALMHEHGIITRILEQPTATLPVILDWMCVHDTV